MADGIMRSPHAYVPTVSAFPELNVARAMDTLKPKIRGIEQAKNDRPPATPDVLDEIEQELVAFIEKERVNSLGALESQLHTFDERIATLDFDGRFAIVRSASAEAVSEFKVESMQGKDHLHALRRELLELEQERVAFRTHHRLTRTASYPSSGSRVLKWAFLLFLFVAETVLNGFFLAKGNDLGVLGGITEAFAFAALNIFATALIGFFGIRWIFHRNLFAKLVGLVSALLFLALAIALNLALAHYREVSGTLIDTASTQIIERLNTNPLGLQDVKSWLFFGIGFLASIFAVIDVISLDDHYPGYGKLSRRLDKARQSYIDEKNMLADQLRDIRGTATTTLEDVSRDLGLRRNEYEAILEQRPRIIAQYQRHTEHLERVANNLLSEYRSANVAARSSPSPKHFMNHKYVADKTPLEDSSRHTNRLAQTNEAIAAAQNDLKGQLAAIHQAYEAAAQEYFQLDTLVTQGTPHGIEPSQSAAQKS